MMMIYDFLQIMNNYEIIIIYVYKIHLLIMIIIIIKMLSKWSLHSIYQKKIKIMVYGKTKHHFTSPNPASFLKDKLSILVICQSCFTNGFGTCIMNIFIPLHLLTKIQNDHHLLKFYLSGSCKSLNNSKLYRFYHINILNSDMF